MKKNYAIAACRKHLRNIDQQIEELNVTMNRSIVRTDSDDLASQHHFADLAFKHQKLSSKRTVAKSLLTALTNYPQNKI